MKIAFADFSGWDFQALSVDQIPMGGAQSALCHLARSLAQLGHDVYLLNSVSVEGRYGGVTSLSLNGTTISKFRGFKLDAMICALTAGNGAALREALGPEVLLILWNQHAANQPGVEPLQDFRERESYDGFAMVSEWQREQFTRVFGLDPARIGVLRNAIAPAFSNLFPGGGPILTHKSTPPILAYTSTPFRGLGLLLDALPAIRDAVPEVRLQVYSSMKVYNVESSQDQIKYGDLYQRCRETQGAEYIGSLPQPELAKRLRQVLMLAYPNAFAETSCISVMEAMASGCCIVTSQLGALAETTRGFGRLIPMGPDYRKHFVEAVVQSLREHTAAGDAAEASLRAQVNLVNTTDTWNVRADEWCQWLNALRQSSRSNGVATTSSMFRIAVQHHQAGRVAEAEQLYRQILAQQPELVEALHNLGVLAHQVGRNDIAVDLIRRAIGLRPNYPEAYNNLGNALKSKGQLDQAIAAYRQSIALEPDYAEAHRNLGNVLIDKGQLDQAITAYRRALDLKPNDTQALSSLGYALVEKGQLDAAIAAYHQVIALTPDDAEAHTNLGNALRHKGQFDEAIVACRRALALRSDLPEAHNNIGTALQSKGNLDEAIAAYRHAVALRPSYPEAHSNLGTALTEKGQLDEAIAACRQAITLRRSYAEARNNLGNALKSKGQLDEAIVAYQLAITLRPGYAEAYSNLGSALTLKGQLDHAIAACRQAITLSPGEARAHNNLGNALKDAGELDAAIAAYGQSLALNPKAPDVHSNLVYALYFHRDYDAAAIAREHRRWNVQHAEPLRNLIPTHSNDRSPDRRLRIGYISPDFRDHCQSLFTVPLFAAHDRRRVELFCYADISRPDDVTRRLQRHAQAWINIKGKSDQDVAALIRHDQIDILVDLTMHMAGNRLLVFARKPAPVQVCWLAYPGSTGLTVIDYRLTDPYLDPPGMNESIYSEKTIRLPDSFWCYDPLDGRDIPINAPPATESGVVTFGCPNNFCKVNNRVVVLWSRVLRQVKNSRLLLLCAHGSHRQRMLEQLLREGIDPQRLEFVPRLPRREYLKLYHRIDIGLDTFPYNGHTTSLDSFWMGVPVVTLVGQRAVSRAGWCQLSNLGLPELAAQTPEQFVAIAVGLANDLPRLRELRSTLRQRMEQSPLMDAPRFARNIEAAYRQMWHKWCDTSSSKG